MQDHPTGQGRQSELGQHANNLRRVFWAMLLTMTFMITEVIGGVISGSLALLADAAHMLADSIALFFAWIAFKLQYRPSDKRRTFGYHRLPVLAAFANGLGLLFIVGWIVTEAISRLADPPAVLATPMLIIAGLGLLVNAAAFWILHGADRSNLNVRGALLHVWGDMLGSVAAVGAAIIILATGWTLADPLLSVVVAIILLRSAWFLLKDSAHVLLEGVPDELDIDELGSDLVAEIAAVEDVHNLHAWSLSQDQYLLTLHARIESGRDPDTVIAEIQARLAKRFGISQATIQIEWKDCAAKNAISQG